MQFLQMLLHLDQNLGHAVAAFGPLIYAVLFAIVFCEMAFLPLFFLPGVPLLFICGSFCAVDSINILVLIPLLIAAAISGSTMRMSWVSSNSSSRAVSGARALPASTAAMPTMRPAPDR